MRVQGIFPLTLALSPEYRGEGNNSVITLRSVPAVIAFFPRIACSSTVMLCTPFAMNITGFRQVESKTSDIKNHQ